MKWMIVLLLFLSGCTSTHWNVSQLQKASVQGIPSQPDVVMELQNWNPSSKELTYEIKNTGSVEYFFGLPFELQVNLDEVWYTVPMKDEFAFETIAILLKPAKSYEQTLPLATYYQTLYPGTYRLVKQLSFDEGSKLIALAFLIK